MPQYKPLGATSNPKTSVIDATENHDRGQHRHAAEQRSAE